MRESGGTPVREILLRREERVAQTEDFRYNPWRGHSFVWIYIVDMHFHILADVFFFDNMNYSSKLFNPTSFVIEPKKITKLQIIWTYIDILGSSPVSVGENLVSTVSQAA